MSDNLLKVKRYKLRLDKQKDDSTLSIIIHRILNDKKILKVENRGTCIAVRLDVQDKTPTGRIRTPYKDYIIHGDTEQDNIILENMLNNIKNKDDMFGDCLIDCSNITFIFVEPKDNEWKKDSVGELAGRIYSALHQEKMINEITKVI